VEQQAIHKPKLSQPQSLGYSPGELRDEYYIFAEAINPVSEVDIIFLQI